MAKTVTYQCDQCGADIKQETSRFMVNVRPASPEGSVGTTHDCCQACITTLRSSIAKQHAQSYKERTGRA